jgi:hypothetical protein
VHGDITRSTFDPDKAYSSVRQQQGRVQVDADWNEQRDIELHDERRLRTDVIGAHGAPLGDPGMQITAHGSGLEIGPGRYYVDGIRVQNPTTLPLTDLPVPADPNLPTPDGHYLAYLEVWEQAVTAVEDPTIREVALGGPDTSTRTRVTWRVRLLKVAEPGPAPNCTSPFPEWERLVEGSTGTLQVRAEAAEATTDECLVPETAGYRGLDNRTYRVQIHDGNFDPAAARGVGPVTPTFKWSRDNGAVLAAWVADPGGGLVVQADQLGPGGTKGFIGGGWVELGNDSHDDEERPGVLAQVEDVSASSLTLGDPGGTLAAELQGAYDADAHPKVRAWDSAGALGLSEGTWIELEKGLEVHFSPSRSWRSGDLWVIPARTAVLPGSRNRQIDWPVDADGIPLPLRAHGPRHHYAPLALAELAGGAWTVTSDCRERFAPMVDGHQFGARGGQGQHAPSGHWLPAPLVAGVSLGTHPLTGALVRFRVNRGGGSLAEAAPDEGGAAAERGEVVVSTGADGLARAWWRLGQGVPPEEPGDTYQPQAAQEVLAELVDAGGDARHVALSFTATAVDPLVLVDAGGNGQLGRPGGTLKLALRARVSAGTQPAAGQRVAFEIQSRMLDGAALDELRGGSLHASVNVLETEPWPAGTRTVRAVVATDSQGVAQVQWILGTEVGLPVQRVTATLLDANDDPTSQLLVYGAHLAIAKEIAWDPCEILGEPLPDATVRGALDLFCHLLGALSAEATVTTKGGKAPPLIPETQVSLTDWTGLEITTRLVLEADPSLEALQSALVVTAEIPETPAGKLIGHTTVRMLGKVVAERPETGAIFRWSATNPSALLAPHTAGGPVLARVTLLPGLLLPRPRVGVPWYGAFWISA